MRLLPATDDEVETYVSVADEDGGERDLHFQEWWVRYRAALPAARLRAARRRGCGPAPGVLDAIADADLVVLAPVEPGRVDRHDPGRIPGVADAVRTAPAPVVGVSPIIGGAVVRGMADACLTAIGVETSAAAVARHYGARSRRAG